MANWSDLKSAVASIIKTNGAQQITGQLLQNVLNNIISNVGLNSTFAGIATPETNPGTPDGNVFYLATTAGTYSNFNGIVINSGEAVILEWKGNWVKRDSGFATNEKLSELGSKVKDNILLGDDDNFVSNFITTLKKGVQYTLTFENSNWNHSISDSLGSTYYLFNIYSFDESRSESTAKKLARAMIGENVLEYYTFTVPEDSDSIRIGLRANKGEKIKYYINEYQYKGNVSIIPHPNFIPNIDLESNTLDLGKCHLIVGENTYELEVLFSDKPEKYREIYLGANETTAVKLYYNVFDKEFKVIPYNQKYTYGDVLIGGIRKEHGVGGKFIDADFPFKYRVDGYIRDMNRREYMSLAYSGGYINIDNINKKFVVVGNLVMRDSYGNYVINGGSEFPFGKFGSNAQALIFDKEKKELYCRTWSDTKDYSSIIASLYIPDLSNVNQVNANSVPIRIDGKSIETEIDDIKNSITDLSIRQEIISKVVLNYTHENVGAGVYVSSQTRNAVIKPLRFDYDVYLTTDANHKLAAQIYDSNQTGAEHLISDDREWTIGKTRTIPANTWFCFIIANIDDSPTDQSTTDSLIVSANIAINKQVLSLNKKINSIIKPIEDYDRVYQGEPLKIVSKYRKKEEFRLNDLGWNQSGTNYGEYGIFFNNEQQLAYLHNIDENKQLAIFNIPSSPYFKPHCNVASIGSEFVSSDSIMPLVYVSQWDIGYEKALFAYDITFDGIEYGIRLHQIIKFNQVSESLIGEGQCDMVVDSDFGFIYTMAYNLRHTLYEEENSTPVCKVMLPTYNQGNLVDGVYEVVITDEDVLDNFVLPRLDTRQDAVCNGGNIILACGYVGYRDNTKIIVIDTVKKEIVTTIPIGKYEDIEPETLLIYKNKLIMTRGNTIFYSIDTY